MSNGGLRRSPREGMELLARGSGPVLTACIEGYESVSLDYMSYLDQYGPLQLLKVGGPALGARAPQGQCIQA